jgi:hypothetical protein
MVKDILTIILSTVVLVVVLAAVALFALSYSPQGTAKSTSNVHCSAEDGRGACGVLRMFGIGEKQ